MTFLANALYLLLANGGEPDPPLKQVVDVVTMIVAVIGVVFGLITLRQGLAQRHTEQQWKRAEFVAKEIKELFSIPQVQTAMWLIDYSALFLNQDGTRRRSQGSAWRITDEVMISSLCDHRTFKDDTESFNDQEMLCREAFDAWLTGLETLYHYVETDLVSIDDLRPHLRYWIKKMCVPDPQWKDLAFYPALAKFIHSYEYEGVVKLCKRFGHEIPQERNDDLTTT